MHFQKILPKVVNYRNFIKYDNERYMNSLQSTLREKRTDYGKNSDKFFEISHTVINVHAP